MYKQIIQFEKQEFEKYKTNYRQEQQKKLMEAFNVLSFDTNISNMLIPIVKWKKFEILLCHKGQCRINNPLDPIEKGDILVYDVESYSEHKIYAEYKNIADDPNWFFEVVRLCDSGVSDSLYPTHTFPNSGREKWNTIPAIYPKHAGKVLDLYTCLKEEEIDKLQPYKKIKEIEREFKHLVKSLKIETQIKKTLFQNFINT